MLVPVVSRPGLTAVLLPVVSRPGLTAVLLPVVSRPGLTAVLLPVVSRPGLTAVLLPVVSRAGLTAVLLPVVSRPGLTAEYLEILINVLAHSDAASVPHCLWSDRVICIPTNDSWKGDVGDFNSEIRVQAISAFALTTGRDNFGDFRTGI